MNATEIIEAIGGRKRVLEITLLTKGRISQWEKQNHIPRPWQMVFHLMNPEIPLPVTQFNAPLQPQPQTPHATNSTPAD